MAKNSNLTAAKKAKNDEFYTQISDIEKELIHYWDKLKGKIVFCNCDDPAESNFWRYFHLNFERIGLKKLISTHYDPEKPTYKLEYEGGDDADWSKGVLTPLKGNGDFRSPECVELLQECDVVVTNPPFSLFREYVAQLVQYGKKFVIIGTLNGVKYKEIFPLIKNNDVWLGYMSPKKFLQPDGTLKSFGNVLWYTNVDIAKRHEKLILFRRYIDDPDMYPKYDNYDVINVDKIADIPEDYFGVMAVPITFLNRHCPEQFQVIDLLNRYTVLDVFGQNDKIRDAKSHSCNIDGVTAYSRILIRRAVCNDDVMDALGNYNRAHGHRAINYDEYFAKNILCFQFDILDVHGCVIDKPDVRIEHDSKCIGVEVTTAVSEDYRLARKFSKLDGDILNVKHGIRGNAKDAVDAIYPIKTDPTTGDQYRVLSPAITDPRYIGRVSIDLIKTVFDAKCKKKDGYAQCDDYWLFIFLQPGAMISMKDLDSLCEYFSTSNCYSHVFLFNEWVLYDCANGTYTSTRWDNRTKYIADNTTIEIGKIVEPFKIFAGFSKPSGHGMYVYRSESLGNLTTLLMPFDLNDVRKIDDHIYIVRTADHVRDVVVASSEMSDLSVGDVMNEIVAAINRIKAQENLGTYSASAGLVFHVTWSESYTDPGRVVASVNIHDADDLKIKLSGIYDLSDFGF